MALPLASQPTSPPQNLGDLELRTWLDPTAATTIAGERLRRPDLVRRFYAGHGDEPFWGSHPEAARALLSAVFRAEEEGLDPALFHAGPLSERGEALSPIARDVLISDAILAYADALAEGAVPRRERPRTQALEPMPIDVVAAIDRAIDAPDPAAALTALAPASPEYEALRRAYISYAHALEAPAAQAETTYPGTAENHRAKYPSREAAWRRARQLGVALERLRWLPRLMPRNRVVANTATQRLQLFENDRPVFAARVVVGQPNWQTPEFHATIDAVLFNPPWNIPTSVLRKEILPKLARDPDYLVRHHMRWRGPTAVQQEAGPHSALGRLKFEMSDPYDVYLHDTPEKHLFHLANRMKSHGCIRIEAPQEMAALLLRESPAEIARGIAEGRTHTQALPEPIDVYIVYQTVTVGPSGTIEFHADPYQRDATLWQLLTRPQGVPIAQNDGVYTCRA